MWRFDVIKIEPLALEVEALRTWDETHNLSKTEACRGGTQYQLCQTLRM